MSAYQTNDQGELMIGGVPATQLAQQYGTPLYVYDVSRIREAIQSYKQAFATQAINYSASYAAKAFATVAMFQVAASEGAHLDLVSGGEITTALKAGFNMQHTSFNGNNKTDEELQLALDSGLGTIIVDNDYELERLSRFASDRGATQDILLRVTPGISAHTHAYIMTGQADSKFGYDVASGQALAAIAKAQQLPGINLRGIHAHIGSQIFEVAGYVAEAQKLVALAAEAHYQPEIIDLGGGFGIRYTDDDKPLPTTTFIDALTPAIQEACAAANMTVPDIWLEPGRSIVGPAGYTLYTAGSRKVVPGIRTYQSIDGGMGDNIRPALYQAKYDVLLASQPDAPKSETLTIAGKNCESGDIIAKDVALPPVHPGDTLAVLATGAYGYSMASLYNRNPRPAVVFAENGKSSVVVRRETWQDLVDHDLDYDA
ncbi:diaminopimelate decarboxylase [Lacticaseibacillus pabuli]|uniref:Diaminopimelate decarboxylase n=1 Tax=Lacticaseibacillus pabuli TaxID=3025672 RepID=A0ABY7WQL7_9LACO|nr:diaminopimelate decarboxylase [Lacticaseibacillus sp. KACC 23028]WDF82483.1 diaminopimelate decarboxylase [Lacticaseibacillus sp. KACC 23028]